MKNNSEMTLQKFKFSLEKRITQEMINNVNVDVFIDFASDDMVARIVKRLFGEILESIKHPANWKESCKEAFQDLVNKQFKKFKPGCAIRSKGLYLWACIKIKYPVKYKIYEATMYYPNIPDQEFVFSFVKKEC